MKLSDILDQEYSPTAADRERARVARMERAQQQRDTARRAAAKEEAIRAAQPISDDAELSRAVARLAEGLGLKRKKRRRS
jgi:hypothetical protein